MLKKLEIARRYLTSLFCFLVFGIGALAISGLIFPLCAFATREPYARRRLFAKIIRWSWTLFLGLFKATWLCKIIAQPQNVLKTVRGHVIVANHPSLVDIILLIVETRDSICIAKESLTRNFFCAGLVNNAYLSNGVPFEKLLEQSKELLAQGFNIIIFPEQTRTRAHTKPTVHLGAFHIAANAGAPVLPVSINFSERVLAKDQFPCYPGTGRVTIRVDAHEAYGVPAELADAPRRIQARALAEKFKTVCFPDL
ncbi:MAG: 1-acyl-sn-glycerol-3-phosphate acyltransferase [Opitutales bacterium]|nr:1-acyl-sn-glycerol-3-phosphate acyltransferase [Opitutales bacterium]